MPIITEPHPAISAPSGSGTIWRFMSVSKFVALITSQTLVFPQVAELAKRDPKEGRYSEVNQAVANRIDTDDEYASQIAKERPEKEPMSLGALRSLGGLQTLKMLTKLSQLTHYVSCWNISQHEPAQLWSMYASESDGIAIKSSLPRVIKSLSASKYNIYPGKIEYLDYKSAVIPTGNGFTPVFRKRVEFSHENELRLCIAHHPSVPQGGAMMDFLGANPPFLADTCSLQDLIEEIRIAPFSGQWLLDSVAKLTEKFGLDVPVDKSSLV